MATIADLNLRNIANMTDIEAMSFVLEVRLRRRSVVSKEKSISKSLEKSLSKLDSSKLEELITIIESRIKKGPNA